MRGLCVEEKHAVSSTRRYPVEDQESHTREEIRKSLEPAFEDIVDSVYAFVTQADGDADVDFEALEETLDEEGDELKRQAAERSLDACEPEADRVRIEGDVYYRCMERLKTYRTPWGEIEPESRSLFRLQGEHNGPTVSPLELRAGIVEGSWTPRAARQMADYIQELPGDRAAELCDLPYSPASLQRLGRRLGDTWDDKRPSIDEALRSSIEVPNEAASISVAVDRVSVLMREEDELNWRMLWCGAVSLHDEEGETLRTWRYGAIPDKSEEALKAPIRRDVEAILDQAPDLDRITLTDGGTDVCQWVDTHFPEWPHRLDAWHVFEKVGKALRSWCEGRPTTQSADEVMSRWRHRLLHEDDAIEVIEASIQRWANGRLASSTEEDVDKALTYIDNHREQMRYGSPRDRGLPVGTGHVEATCKSLVALRMKRNGQRWSYQGAQAILDLRSLALSDRWDEGMDALMETYRQPVQAAPAQAA